MIALLHDGRAGHRSQAEGLRAWLGKGSVHEVSWPGRPQERFARAALWLWQRPVGRVEPPVAAATGVVSVGTRAAAGALAEAARLGVPAIAMMAPYGVPRHLFAGHLLPPHDLPGAGGPRVCRVLVAPCALSWQAGPREGVVLLVGGGRHGRHWPWEPASAAVAALARSLPDTPLTIAVSRRTPEPFVAAMRAAGHLVASPGSGPTVGAMLAGAGAVVVTDDSYSMVGEAVQAGFRPLVWRLGGAGRLGLGLAALAGRRWIRWEEPGGIPDPIADAPAPGYGEVREHIAQVAKTVAEWLS